MYFCWIRDDPSGITRSRRADVPLKVDARDALDCQHYFQNACAGSGSDVVRCREIFGLHALHDLSVCLGHIIDMDVVANTSSVGRWIVTAKNLWISARGESSKDPRNQIVLTTVSPAVSQLRRPR